MRRRGVVIGVAGAVAVAIAALSASGGDGYVIYATFAQAGGLRQGFKVRIDGAPVGEIAGLTLDHQDRVVAKLSIDKSAAPLGAGVRATARAADLLGEKFVDLTPGDRSRPLPSGSVIPTSRTALAVELDDVINTIDLPTREALRAFLDESGQWFVGRGQDLGATLAALPDALDRSGALLHQFAIDNTALGRLVEESDRVVGSIARERSSLGHLVGAAAGTFDTLGRRDAQLSATVREAPSTLRAARRALTALENAAAPLGPAARGLGATAPELTATLDELPGFTAAAGPTLQTIRRVSPTLTALGRSGTPLLAGITPLAGKLETFSTAFAPVAHTFGNGIGDVLGVLEGWARSTQGEDAASHIFRFGFTVGPSTLASLTALLKAPTRHRSGSRPAVAHRLSPLSGQVPRPPLVAKDPGVRLPGRPPLSEAQQAGSKLLNYLLGG